MREFTNEEIINYLVFQQELDEQKDSNEKGIEFIQNNLEFLEWIHN